MNKIVSDQISMYNFNEYFVADLTPFQRKIAALAVAIFSCLALAYYFYRFCSCGHNNKIKNLQVNAVAPKKSDPKSEVIQIYIKSLDSKLTQIDMCDDAKIADIKVKIQDLLDIPTTVQRLIFDGKRLNNDKTLRFYNIQKDSTVHLVFNL